MKPAISLRGVLGALTAMLVAFCSLAASGTASAVYYCNIGVAPYSQCSNASPVAQWNHNIAQYPGGGIVSVCEKETWASSDPASNGYQLSRVCGDNAAVGYASNNWSWLGYQERNFVGNNSGFTHTVTGIVDPYGCCGLAASSSSRANPLGATVAPASLPAETRNALGVLRSSSAGKISTITLPSDQVSLRATQDRLCLTSSMAGGEITCQHNEYAAQGRLLAATICGLDQPVSDVVLYGVVPDGVSAVGVATEDGKVLSESRVAGNTFRIQMPKTSAVSAHHLEWDGRAQSFTVEGVLPDDLSCV